MKFADAVRVRIDQHVGSASRRVLMAAVIVAFAIALAGVLREEAAEKSSQWTRLLPFADSTTLPTVTVAAAASARGSEQEAQRLEAQVRQVRARATLHLRVMSTFYSRYFASVTVATVLMIIAGLCLLPILRVGWADANAYISTAFAVSLGLGLFYQLSPMLFRQEENIAANKALYLEYVALDNEIQTYLVTGRRSSDTADVGMPVLLLDIDKRMAKLADLPIGFDAAQIPDYAKLPGVDKASP